MDEKIKKIIDNNKKDNQVLKNYVDAFVKSEGVNEEFKESDEYKYIKGKEEIQEIKEEDEFF